MLERFATRRRCSFTATATDEILYHLLEPEERRGLGLLPAPSPGDVFFDMEGDPFFDPACGLEFLFGVLWREPDGATTYRPFWAYDRDGEQDAFERVRRLRHRAARAFPDMHVYHYAAYEPSTLARLMGAHATREEEIDELLRGEVLVDLLQVVRQSLRAGVESYSLKDVEKLFFTRKAEVELGQRGGDRVRALARRPRPGAPRRHRRLQRGGLPRDARAARLAARRVAARPQTQYGVEIPFLPPPERDAPAETDDEPDRDGAAPRRAARRRRRRATARAVRRGCSSTTSARRARPGGGTSAVAR